MCWEMKAPKNCFVILAQSPLLPQRQGDCPLSVLVTGRHPSHFSSVTSTPGILLFLKMLKPPFLNFFIIHPKRN